MEPDWTSLIEQARQAARRAYARYSGLQVGAAALTDQGRVVTGCNVENASYGLTLCAECILVGNLRLSGGERLVAVAVAGPDGQLIPPCGRCRQVLLEHAAEDGQLLTADGPIMITALLPGSFGEGFLPDRRASSEAVAGPVGADLQAAIQAMPKVALHDHLDGGLRPQTMIELAAAAGHDLPTTDPAELATWFFAAADSGSLPRYLETFDHTVACLQTAEALTRVAYEWVLDLAADNVVYGEARWAPTQHEAGGLTLVDAVRAVGEGLRRGSAETGMVAGQLLTGMRQDQRSDEVAQLVVDRVDDTIVGFDLAGPEAGFPPSGHAAAFDLLRSHGCPVTIHAGEAAGLESIEDALERGARRLGHGVRLVDDLAAEGPGEVATRVAAEGIVLEVCPSSNLQTGIAETMAEHPFGQLWQAGLPVTVSCDNRLMSRTTMTRELTLVAETFGLGLADLQELQQRALAAGFAPESVKVAVAERLA